MKIKFAYHVLVYSFQIKIYVKVPVGFLERYYALNLCW